MVSIENILNNNHIYKMADTMSGRIERIEESVTKFLNGESRKPYMLRKNLVQGLKNSTEDGFSPKRQYLENKAAITSSPCICKETLGQFSDQFHSMLHTGPKLIYRARIQEPKTENKKYRDISKQNQWLLENIFDSHGNYLYCHSCLKRILGVGAERLHRLREIKREQSNASLIVMQKEQIAKEQMGYIVPPIDEPNVLFWWNQLKDNSVVELRFPPKLHQGKSNYSKQKFLPRFLEFIDNNSQPNGRQVGSHGSLFFLNSKFNRINAPSASEADKPESWKSRSLVYEFNRSLEEGEHISNGTAKKWLKLHRPKHAISPKKTDYCALCIECEQQKRKHETIAMRLQQNGQSDEKQIVENEILAESYGLLLQEHKMAAGQELEYYRQKTQQSRALYRQIEDLEKKDLGLQGDSSLLRGLRAELPHTLSLDYQQSQLVPYWGFSPQPSETYYLRKLSHHIFGIVDHTQDHQAVYVCEERVIPSSNADMTVSLTDHYLTNNVPSWVKHLRLFMDNGPTNKNQFMIQWALEQIERGKYETIRMCFFVPGHAKNDVDRLFARLAHAFKNNDILVTENLLTLIKDTIEPKGTSLQVTNRDLITWRNLLATKYNPLEKIKQYYDFLIKRNTQGKPMVYCKEHCYEGQYVTQDLLKANVDAGNLMDKLPLFSYQAKGLKSDLTQEKLEDLAKMYDKFIDPSLRPAWLPTSSLTRPPQMAISSPSSNLARQHRAESKKSGGKKP